MPDLPPLASLMPFTRRRGIRFPEASRERVVAELDGADDLCTAGGVLHGGALMTLADSAGALCAFLNLPEGAMTTTIESKTNFFRPLRRGTARATSTPLHTGRTIVVVQTDLRDGDDRRLALVTQTQAVLMPGA